MKWSVLVALLKAQPNVTVTETATEVTLEQDGYKPSLLGLGMLLGALVGQKLTDPTVIAEGVTAFEAALGKWTARLTASLGDMVQFTPDGTGLVGVTTVGTADHVLGLVNHVHAAVNVYNLTNAAVPAAPVLTGIESSGV